MDKTPGIADARMKVDHIHRYVDHCTPSVQQQDILSKQILIETPTELRYVERCVFLKEVNNQNLWNFELGSQESMNVRIWRNIRLQRDRQGSQALRNQHFFNLPVTIFQCIFGTEKYPNAGIILNYDDDDYSQGFAQIKNVFRALTKEDILQPYNSLNKFRSSNVRADDDGYNLYDFDIRYRQNYTASEPTKVQFKFNRVVPNDVKRYALVLTNKLISIICDRQRQFDLN